MDLDTQIKEITLSDFSKLNSVTQKFAITFLDHYTAEEVKDIRSKDNEHIFMLNCSKIDAKENSYNDLTENKVAFFNEKELSSGEQLTKLVSSMKPFRSRDLVKDSNNGFEYLYVTIPKEGIVYLDTLRKALEEQHSEFFTEFTKIE